MKTSKSIIAAFFLTILAASAATIIFQWSPNDPAEDIKAYNLYEQTGTNWTQLASVTNSTVTVSNVAIGSHTYGLTATNILGESERTVLSAVVIPALPTAPTNPVTTIVIQVFTSP